MDEKPLVNQDRVKRVKILGKVAWWKGKVAWWSNNSGLNGINLEKNQPIFRSCTTKKLLRFILSTW